MHIYIFLTLNSQISHDDRLALSGRWRTGSRAGKRTPCSPVCQGPATVTGPRVFWDPRGMALLQKHACGGQAASESHGQGKRGVVQQRHVWPEEVLKRGGRTQSLRQHGGFQYIPVTGSPATCVKPAAAHVSIRGLARRSAGKRRTATTNAVSDCTKIAGHLRLQSLSGRSILRAQRRK